MTTKISTAEVRLRIGDLLNRVALRGDEFVIERKGKPMAALVPVARLEQMRRAARTALAEFFATPPSKGDPSDDEVMRIAVDAQRKVRSRARRAGRGR